MIKFACKLSWYIVYFYGIVSHYYVSVSSLLVALPVELYYFWLLFRVLLSAALPVLLPVALPGTTSGCSLSTAKRGR